MEIDVYHSGVNVQPRSLACFPPEIWTIISQYKNVTTNEILRLCATGCRMLIYKIQQGCECLRLEERRINAVPIIEKWPPLISQFMQLRDVTIICPSQPLPVTIFNMSCHSGLQSLHLHGRDLHNLVGDFDFAKHFPLLTHLKLYDTGYLPNYLPNLPPTLTHLETSALIGLPVMDEVHAKQLPPQLQVLRYGLFECDEFQMSFKMDYTVTKHLPKTIQSFQNVNEFVRYDAITTLMPEPFLPPHLTSFNAILQYCAPMSMMPKTLMRLTLKTCTFTSIDEVRTIWTGIASLKQLVDLNIDVYHTIDKEHLFDVNEWSQLLPPRLKQFKTTQRLPIKRMGVMIQWPNDLRELIMPGLTMDDDFFAMSLSPVAYNWGLTRLSKLETFTMLISDTYSRPLPDTSVLPVSLTSATLYLKSDQCNLSHLTQLSSLHLTIFDCHDSLYVINLPASLHHFGCYGYIGREFTSKLAGMLAQALPPTIETFNLHRCNLPVYSVYNKHNAVALVRSLPRALKQLRLSFNMSVNDGHDGIINLVKALPPQLEVLVLNPETSTSWPSNQYHTDIQMSALPKTLRELCVYSPYEFAPSSFDQCMPNLRHLEVSIHDDASHTLDIKMFPKLEAYCFVRA